MNVVDLCPPPTDKETIEPMVGEVNLCPSLTDKKTIEPIAGEVNLRPTTAEVVVDKSIEQNTTASKSDWNEKATVTK